MENKKVKYDYCRSCSTDQKYINHRLRTIPTTIYQIVEINESIIIIFTYHFPVIVKLAF